MDKKYYHYNDENKSEKKINEEIYELFKDDFNSWDNLLIEHEKNMILDYSHKRGNYINDVLWGKIDFNNQEIIEDILTNHVPTLDSAVKKGNISRDVVLYRGAHIDNLKNLHEAYEKISINDFKEYVDYAYFSTSVSKRKAKEFLKDDKEYKFLFQIYTDKGVNCAFVSAGNKKALFREHEVLLPRQTKLEILNIVKEKDTIIIKCKVVNQNDT